MNASILLFDVLMLAWHNIWMARHGREMAQRAKDVGHQVAAGTRPLYALALICGFAVLREGAETVLFVFSIVASAQEGVPALLFGGLIGLVGGTALGRFWRSEFQCERCLVMVVRSGSLLPA